MAFSFILTGGGTGGHVFPALAVGRVLRARGHRTLFVGRAEGIEARLVPEAGFEIGFVRSGGWNRVGFGQQLRTAAQMPAGAASAWRTLQRFRPDAVFSTGGYAAVPVMLASVARRIPVVVMEPNAVPGVANRLVGRRVYRALVGFAPAQAWFPAGRSEVTGVPVRAEFFQLSPKRGGVFTLLITGGSLGARSLNRAARESWPLFRSSGEPIQIIHQSGPSEHAPLEREFADSGLAGRVVPFLSDMAGAFGEADVVVSRSGAGTVNEIAAARRASILVPFPFAADDHQSKNAETLAMAGAARFVPDRELSGERLFSEVEALRADPKQREEMQHKVGAFAHPGAAERAADVMEAAARREKVP